MDSFEWNKIFGAILAAVLAVQFINWGGEVIYHNEDPVVDAYPVVVADAAATGAVEAPVVVSIGELMQTASASKGENGFKACAACHTVTKGGANKVGPNLYGIMGRAVGAADGFKYSSALNGTGQSWTYELMDQWLKNPKKTFDGTSMSFAGIRKDGRRADVIAYLRSLADAPIDLPAVPEVSVEASGE